MAQPEIFFGKTLWAQSLRQRLGSELLDLNTVGAEGIYKNQN